MSDIQGVSGTDTEKSAAAPRTPTGVSPPGAAGGRSGFLSDVIVELGFASQATVEQAVRAARSPGTTVARVLLDMNAISEEQLARATAERYGIDYIELEGFRVDSAAANLITPAAAQRYQAVPVAFLGQVLLVAMGDPADSVGVKEIAAMTARTVRPAIASRPALEALLRALPLEESPVVKDPAPPPVAVEDVGPRAPESPAAPPPAPAGVGETSKLREELNALKEQFAGAQAKPQDAEPEAAVQPADVAVLQAKLAEAEAELEDARARVREAKEVSAELEALREDLAAAEAGLLDRESQGDTPDSGRARAREHARQVESELRRIRADVDLRSGELEVVRSRLTEAETELVRVRAELDTRGSQLEAMRTRAESAEAEAESALRRVAETEREADEARRDAAHARRLAEELGGTNERADGARMALAELRAENERERELSAVSERDLRESLRKEEARRAELEQRLSEVEGSAFAAERAFEELREAQGRMRGALRELAQPDAPGHTDERDG